MIGDKKNLTAIQYSLFIKIRTYLNAESMYHKSISQENSEFMIFEGFGLVHSSVLVASIRYMYLGFISFIHQIGSESRGGGLFLEYHYTFMSESQIFSQFQTPIHMPTNQFIVWIHPMLTSTTYTSDHYSCLKNRYRIQRKRTSYVLLQYM